MRECSLNWEEKGKIVGELNLGEGRGGGETMMDSGVNDDDRGSAGPGWGRRPVRWPEGRRDDCRQAKSSRR